MSTCLVWSHRGNVDIDDPQCTPYVNAAGGRAPAENSLGAFRLAQSLAIEGIETDTWLSADGEFVVVHDRQAPVGLVDRLRRIEVPNLPTLAEVVSAAGRCWVNVELKMAPEASRELARATGSELAAKFLSKGAADRVVVSSFSRHATDGVLAAAPFLKVGHLCEYVPDGEGLRRLASAGYWAIHAWVGSLDGKSVEAVHEAGLAVVGWTVNDTSVAARLAQLGTEVLITDRPLAVSRACA